VNALDAQLRAQLGHTLRRTRLNEQLGSLTSRYEGKVRDTYERDDELVLVTTDRISAFDHVLRQTIPFKGQVLNQLAAHFFEATSNVAANHVVSVPDSNVTVARRCEPVPIEFVVRGYLAGHAWRTYDAGKRTLCGQPLPDGLRRNSRLRRPILTPATKAEEGHDEDISRSEIVERGLLEPDVFDKLQQKALALFERGTEMAAERGLILVDTKYEFGRAPDGNYLVIDEIHTPDSSRYFYADTYEERLAEDRPQRQLSKEFVREWLMEHGFKGKPGQALPDLPDDFRVTVAQRYAELYEAITGEAFQPDTHENPEERIRRALQAA
jgi:phosphoribosylaminoimidazole-succinocarboxamide synthase